MHLSFHSFYLKVPSLLSFMVAVVRPLNHVQLFVTPWTVAHQAPLPMGFPRQEHWSGLLFPPPGDLPNPGVDLMLLNSLGCLGKSPATQYPAPNVKSAEPRISGIG